MNAVPFDHTSLLIASDAPPLRDFLFLRHGRTAYNCAGLIQGHRDIPLDDVGEAQALAAAEVFSRRTRIRRVVASDLSRAFETARIVAARTGLQVVTDPDLRERGFGPFEGGRVGHDFWNHSVEGVEDLHAFARRLQSAMRRHLAEEDGVLLVAHGGVLRMIGWMLDKRLEPGFLRNAAPLALTRPHDDWQVEDLEPPAVAAPLS